MGRSTTSGGPNARSGLRSAITPLPDHAGV